MIVSTYHRVLANQTKMQFESDEEKFKSIALEPIYWNIFIC
jgi:hypothetical protein